MRRARLGRGAAPGPRRAEAAARGGGGGEGGGGGAGGRTLRSKASATRSGVLPDVSLRSCGAAAARRGGARVGEGRAPPDGGPPIRTPWIGLGGWVGWGRHSDWRRPLSSAAHTPLRARAPVRVGGCSWARTTSAPSSTSFCTTLSCTVHDCGSRETVSQDDSKRQELGGSSHVRIELPCAARWPHLRRWH
jgi:hypothetical protein